MWAGAITMDRGIVILSEYIMRHAFVFILIGAWCSVSCTRSYLVRIDYKDRSSQQISFRAKNDSLANVYGFQKYVEALNGFERTEGNKTDVDDIDYGKMPISLSVYREKPHQDVTNITAGIQETGIREYNPSPARLAAEKKLASQASVAWGELKFGMSLKEVQQYPLYQDLRYPTTTTISVGGQVNTTKSVSISRKAKKAIAAQLNLECAPDLRLVFFGPASDELTEVCLTCESSKNPDYDLIVDCQRLFSYITDKYGEKSLRQNNMSKLIAPGGGRVPSFDAAKWVVGHKTMALSVSGLGGHGMKYSLVIKNDEYPTNHTAR